MSLEGELKVGLRLRDARIAAVDITSTRPDIASRLLQGRRRDEAQAAVPLLFSVCARSQAAAVGLACAAAAGERPDAAALAQARAALAEETVRETAWQVLLHQPRWLDEAATPAQTAALTAAARAAQAWRCAGSPAEGGDSAASTGAQAAASAAGSAAGSGAASDATSDAAGRAAHDAAHPAADHIAQAVFGGSAADWLQLASWPAVTDWAAAGRTVAARYLHHLAHAEAGPGLDPGLAPPLLPPPTPGWLAAVAAAAAADPAYTRRPHWQGRPAETGALARLQGDPLLGHGVAPAPSRLLARHVARLRELALLLQGRLQPALGALCLAPGSGVGWVDNARGLLVHHVQLDGDRVRLYRIVAPTEWNFHPQGALAAALVGAPAADPADARRRALRLVNSLDPCVNCTIGIDDA